MKQNQTDPGREDLRQKRTRKFLMNALMELMEERSFAELSVVDICERAMVHRTTFYAHFEDKDDLLRYVLAELWREFGAAEPSQGEDRANLLFTFQNALAFIRDHKRLYLSGLAGGGTAPRMLEDFVVEELLGRMREPDEAAACFFVGGVLSLIRWWLEHNMPVGERELLQKLDRFLPPEPTGKG